MDIKEAVKQRHSVRRYIDKPIEGETLKQLSDEIKQCVYESGLGIRLIKDEPKAFGGFIPGYGIFKNVKNYIILSGAKTEDFDEKAGWYGERIVLKATQLGLDTCWVGLTFKKGAVKNYLKDGNKIICVIAVGYGENHGVQHKRKTPDKVCVLKEKPPKWFKEGGNAARVAPTAINQQRFKFYLNGRNVRAVSTGGFYSKVDLGIVKYHFSIGAGEENFNWE